MVWIIHLDTLSLGDIIGEAHLHLPALVDHAPFPVSELVLLWKQLRLRWYSSRLPEI